MRTHVAKHLVLPSFLVGLAFALGCSNMSGTLGPVCADYLGDNGCCLKAAGNDQTAIDACQQAATTYANSADPLAAEASCREAQDSAIAAGLCATPSGSSSSTPSAVCASYLSCASQVAPLMFPAALSAYDEASPCWSSADLRAECSLACQGELNSLRMLPAAATVSGCIGCSADSDCGGALPACDSTKHVCTAGCVIQGSFIAADSVNPMNPCESCQPYTSTSDWTPLTEGTSCAAGRVCSAQKCLPSFSLQPSPTTATLNGVWGTGNGEVYAVGNSGTILKSTGGGVFALLSSGTNADLYGVWGSSPTDVYAVGGGVSIHTADGGMTWTKLNLSTRLSYAAIWGSSSTDLYIAANAYPTGGIEHSTDGGMTWNAADLPLTVVSVWGSSSMDVYAVGSTSSETFLQHSTDGGLTWPYVPSAILNPMTSIWGSSSKDIYAVGASSTNTAIILHSTDSGMTWTQKPLTEPALLGIWGSSRTDVYAVGHGGTLLSSTDGGMTWSHMNMQTANDLRSIWGSASDGVYVVGQNGTILH